MGKNRSASLRVRMIDRMGMRCADHFLTVSTFQTQAFVHEGIPEERISLVRNGVDLELFRMLPFPERPPFTFGYVGDFQHWQGIDNLIEAFRRVEDPEARMLLVGFRKEDQPLKERLHNIFGTRVTLVDRCDRQTLVKLVEEVAVLVIPRIDHQAIRHAFPTKFAEYAAMGRPILVNSVDETAEFVRKYRCGFVSSPLPDSMSATMRQAATTNIQTLALMGIRARKMAEEHFSWNRIGDDYFRVVARLVEESRKAST